MSCKCDSGGTDLSYLGLDLSTQQVRKCYLYLLTRLISQMSNAYFYRFRYLCLHSTYFKNKWLFIFRKFLPGACRSLFLNF